MLIYLAVLLSLLQGISQRGAKMVVSLSALSMGATPFQVGILHGLFALFPLVLAVYAGKVSDRIGVKRPIVGGSVMMSAGILVPFVSVGAVVLGVLGFTRVDPAASPPVGGRRLAVSAIIGGVVETLLHLALFRS